LADAALRILARRSWAELTLAEVARSAKTPLSTLIADVPSKGVLIGLILRRTSDQTAVRYRKDPNSENVRDRVFDVALTWLELLGPHKAAMRSLYRGLGRDPMVLVQTRGAFLAHAESLLALAEADSGRMVALRAAALALTLARAIAVWFDDDKQLTRTMARLDEDLRRAKFLF
jgi:AcrR family transcriptional regulator